MASLIVAMAVGHAVAAIFRRPEARDERDRLIAWRAESNASWVVSAGAFLAISGLVFGVGAVWIAHLLLLSMFLSELLKCAFQLVYYRRGV